MDPEQKPGSPGYGRQWVTAFVLLGAVLTASAITNWRQNPVTAPDLPSAEAASYVDWFMIVRCPEMPIEAGGATNRLHEWFLALRDSGFHPRPFSEVVQRLRHGEKVPKNTVVLLFDPAYRKTVEQVLPLMEAERIPALWITRSPGTIRADRRFVSSHERKTLGGADLWNFALDQGEHGFLLEETSAPNGMPRFFEWEPGTGVTGVNSQQNLNRLRRLHANAHWSASEFVDRLKADLELRGPANLSARVIDGKTWGIISDPDRFEPFDLATPPKARSASLTWWGTKGVQDLAINLEIESWFGETWIILRSNETRTEGIRVGLTEGRIRVLQESGGEIVAETSEAWPIDPVAGIQLKLRLEGSRLEVTSPIAPKSMSAPVLVRGTEQSKMDLALYHRIRGAAKASQVQITAAPLSREGLGGQMASAAGVAPATEQSSENEQELSPKF